MDWDSMRARLHAVPGFEGDANKAKRKAWIAAALGFRDAPPADLFRAYGRAGVEQRIHVERCLEEMERPWKAFRSEMATGECLCAEIDPSDRPCLTCDARADLAQELS